MYFFLMPKLHVGIYQAATHTVFKDLSLLFCGFGIHWALESSVRSPVKFNR